MPGGPERLGVSLWTMQSTAAAPREHGLLYGDLLEDARLVERLGFGSLWTGEHRGWYDGWCPAPIHALAGAAAVTSTLRLGTAMLLLPQHDARSVADAMTTFDGLLGDRLDLGVALGYRDAEYDALGLRRDHRGRLMDAALEELAAARPDDRPLWIGGLAPAALRRAARHGHGLLLPQTVPVERVAELAERHRAAAGRPVPIGVTRDVWVDDRPRATERFRARLAEHFREEVGSWWVLGGELGFQRPEALDDQLRRIDGAALVGPPERVAADLRALEDAGVDLLLLRVNFDFVGRSELHEQLERIARQVAPLLAGTAVA